MRCSLVALCADSLFACKGVGPRRKRVLEKVGRDGADDDEEEGDHDALLREFKFAPKDVEIFEAEVKDNLFGLLQRTARC